MVPEALDTITVDSNLDANSLSDGSRKPAKEAHTPELKTSNKKHERKLQRISKTYTHPGTKKPLREESPQDKNGVIMVPNESTRQRWGTYETTQCHRGASRVANNNKATPPGGAHENLKRHQGLSTNNHKRYDMHTHHRGCTQNNILNATGGLPE